ncbi:LLM class flavin-dependent oxidoreductase [Microbacterium lushaniae]|uniref:LLM class flavin-dependent oxidoreductase n=2 Tax=Microbacterium lushaniae TaxID=2614639 RepID=A0A5J6L7T9_9MICO|nr:LLM class flavin-dependent oxidoreductase [Microbacterium lushaniae]
MPLPMPLAPPVTTATRPFQSLMPSMGPPFSCLRAFCRRRDDAEVSDCVTAGRSSQGDSSQTAPALLTLRPSDALARPGVPPRKGASMHIGLNFGFGKLDPEVSDHDVYRNETELAVLAEGLGYDSVWAVEHHFSDYAFCPDNLLWLAHVAARTSSIKLGTGAVILPWNTQPIRVAEKLLMLDHLSEGRVLFGMGRGLSRKEFEPFGIPLEETRGRFDESSKMIIEAIESGYMQGDGPFFPVPRTPIKPGPFAPWGDRIFTVAGSHDSMVSGVNNKCRLMSFILRPVDKMMPTFQAYLDYYREVWDEQAPPVSLNVAMYCHEDAQVALDGMYEYVGNFFEANVDHYEMDGVHFADTKGYERYADTAALIREKGVSKAGRDYADAALYGTPQEILDKLVWIQEQMGQFDLVLQPSFGGMSHDTARKSVELFAREVMPKARQHYDATVSASV